MVLFRNRPKKFDFVHQTVSCWEVHYKSNPMFKPHFGPVMHVIVNIDDTDSMLFIQ